MSLPGKNKDVFISYSRNDIDFVNKLCDSLQENGLDWWIDRNDISPGEPWKTEVEIGIDSSYNFIFVLSEKSVTSEYCQRELGYADKNNKKIVPLVLEDVDPVILENPIFHKTFSSGDYVYFRDGVDHYSESVCNLIAMIHADQDWVKTHAQLLTSAMEWKKSSVLLSGKALKESQIWLSHANEHEKPQPTPLINQFIIASQNKITRSWVLLTVASSVLLCITMCIAIYAWYQRGVAIQSARMALSHQLAVQAQNMPNNDNALVLLLSLEAYKLDQNADALSGLLYGLEQNTLSVLVEKTLADLPAEINVLTFSPNGNILAAGDQDGNITLWDMKTYQKISAPLVGHSKQITSLVFSNDSKYLYSGSADKTIRFWDINIPSNNGLLGTHLDTVCCVTLSPNGKILASGSSDNIQLWDLVSKQRIAELRVEPDLILTNLVFHPVDDRFLVAEYIQQSLKQVPGFIYLWNIESQVRVNSDASGAEYNLMWTHGGVMALSPEGSMLAEGGELGLIDFWSIESAQDPYPIGMKLHHPGFVTSLIYNPDGTILASGSTDATIMLWYVANISGSLNFVNGVPTKLKNPVQSMGESLRGHTDMVTSLVFSPDGKMLVSASSDKSIILWNTDVQSWQSLACQIANRNLTQEEWQYYLPSERYQKTCSKLP
jgi:WD40 repeat protein